VQCLDNNNCQGGFNHVCNPATHTCVGCVDQTDCGGNTPVCDTGTHTCRAMCTTNMQCQTGGMFNNGVCNTTTGSCVQCLTNQNCQNGQICNPATNACVQCVQSTDCQQANNVCLPNNTCAHFCTTNAQCTQANRPYCEPTLGACVQCATNGDCNNNQVCSANHTCVGG
jgi:Cys-rich repeat protein